MHACMHAAPPVGEVDRSGARSLARTRGGSRIINLRARIRGRRKGRKAMCRGREVAALADTHLRGYVPDEGSLRRER